MNLASTRVIRLREELAAENTIGTIVQGDNLAFIIHVSIKTNRNATHCNHHTFPLSSYAQHATVETASMVIALTQLFHAIHGLRFANVISHDSTRFIRSDSLTFIVIKQIASAIGASAERMNSLARSIHRVIHYNHHTFPFPCGTIPSIPQANDTTRRETKNIAWQAIATQDAV